MQLAGLKLHCRSHQGTMEKIVIYKAGRPKEIYILKLAQVLKEAAQEIKAAVSNCQI